MLEGGWSPILMAGKVWDSLPGETKLQVAEVNARSQWLQVESIPVSVNQVRDEFAKRGNEIYKLDPAEWAKWEKLVMPITDKIAAELEANGQPIKEIREIVESSKFMYE